MSTSSVWAWFAVAAAGALHGLNPAAGWVAVAWFAREGGGAQVLRPLVPIVAGHVASLAMVAAAVPAALQLGWTFDPLVPQGVAAALLLAMALGHLRGHRTHVRTGLGLWSFIVGLAHGAGWMLVPAVVPLCGGDGLAREITASGSLLLALGAVAVHLAAMLGTTAVMALGARLALRRVGRFSADRARPGGGVR